MNRDRSLGSHLHAAFTGALALALCQVVIETVIIALRTGGYILGPDTLVETQMYDFCVKLAALLPGLSTWLEGSALDSFLPAGFSAKLVIGGALVLPNVLIIGVLASVVGVVRYVTGRPARPLAIVATLVIGGLLVHLVSLAAAVHVPKAWTLRALVRNAARVLVWEGAFVALIALALSGGAAVLIARLRPAARWAVSVATLALAIAATLGLAPARPASSATRTDPVALAPSSSLPPIDSVVLISIDSLRADRLGCYGNVHDTSPALDELARSGARFADVMSTTSWTLPAHASLLTGRYLLSHGVITQDDRLPDNVPTLAESLQHAGFMTGGIVSALFLKSHYGFNRGFEYYDDETIPPASWREELSIEPAPVVAELATKWLRERGRKRFFLFLHFWDVHYDYVPPPPYDSMFDPDYRGSINGVNFYHNDAIGRGMPQRDLDHVLALYDGEIRWVDDHIGQILRVLDEIGVADRTAVVVTADHGDEFFEHGYKGHQRTLYREVVQVPLIMRVPGLPRGQVVDDRVTLADVMPTILDLTGLPMLPGMNGTSLVPAMMGRPAAGEGMVQAWLCNPKRKKNCEAMQYSSAGTLFHVFQPMKIEFYAPSDLRQQNDLAPSGEWPRDEQLKILAEDLDSRWSVYRGLGAQRGTVKIDQGTLERLRALGYVD